MLGFGPPANRQARQEWWRRQIQRQSECHLTVAEFCRRLGVSTVTFYAWKRRLREAHPGAPLLPARPAAPPLAAPTAPTPAFLPVAIRAAGPDPQLEIELPNACVVRLTGTIDPGWLRTAIDAAGRLGTGAPGGE
jgi:transposase-like protein